MRTTTTAAEGLTFLAAAAAAAATLVARARQRAREGDLRVQSLHVHAVKGARGHAVPRALLDAFGMVWDRRWMLVRGGDDRLFTTQRQVPLLATLEATVLLPAALGHLATPPAAVVDASVRGVTLRLTATAGPSAGRSLDVPAATLADARAARAVAAGVRAVDELLVWGKPVSGAVDQGDAAAAWLTAALGEALAAATGLDSGGAGEKPGAAPAAAAPLRLVYFDPAASSRLVSRSFAPPDAPPALGAQVGFADGYPLLLASAQSLDALNAALPRGEGPLPMDRFRPNIVVAADAPWAEDSWRRFTIGPPPGAAGGGGGGGGGGRAPLRMWGVKRCSRCKVPTIDQASGLPHASAAQPEPLATMRRFRGDARGSGEVYFGQNVQLELGVGEVVGAIEVGDVVRLLEVVPVAPL